MSKKAKEPGNAFAYDDAFRTMEGECDDILIPFVNYVFGEHYTKEAVIRRMRNEHFIARAGETEEKRVTDSHFEISERGISKRYHIECESKPYDNSLLIRFLEYDTSTAMDDVRWEGDKLVVRFPNSGLLLLRNSKKTPQEAQIVMETPGGAVSYPIKILKVSDYSVEEIFEKHLYLLIPFYIFNYEKNLSTIAGDEIQTDVLAGVYNDIVERLNKEQEVGSLSAFSFSVIINMTKKVLDKLAHKHGTVRRKVGEQMGGRVLDLPIIRAYHEAKDAARAELLTEMIRNKVRKGKPLDVIAEELEMKSSELQDIYDAVIKETVAT